MPAGQLPAARSHPPLSILTTPATASSTSSSSGTRFDRDTALEPTGEAGVYRARVDPGWFIVVGPNGGYIATILLRAMQLELADAERRPRSLSVHYTAPAREGPCQVRVRIERSGRSVSTLTARLEQAGRLIALATGAFSKARTSLEFQDARMPEVRGPEHFEPRSARAFAFSERFEQRFAIGEPGFTGAAQAVTGGWIRPAEPRQGDSLLVAQLTDAWPPAIFTRCKPGDLQGGAPTLDLTIHFRANVPASQAPDDFYLAMFATRTAHEGFVEEDGELWSRDGTLLAQSRQLALIR